MLENQIINKPSNQPDVHQSDTVLHDQGAAVVAVGAHKKYNFAEVELQKKAYQIFGVLHTGNRPQTSMNLKQAKYEIAEGRMKRYQQNQVHDDSQGF